MTILLSRCRRSRLRQCLPLLASNRPRLERVDWVMTDLDESACATGVPGLLHGLFYPSVRLLSTREEERGLEVGYPKDIVRWRNEASLKHEVEKGLRLIREPSIRIPTPQEA